MTQLKMNFQAINCVTRSILITLVGTLLSITLTAQSPSGLRASVAASIGYAPAVTQGNDGNFGMVIGVHGELEYGVVIGRLQYTRPLLGTFQEDSNLNGGESFHGSLGYRLDLSGPLSVGFLASGGATIIRYHNGINGSIGDTFTNVSPQVGVIVAPNYQLSDHFSIQGGLRYYKGFPAGDRGQAIDLADISVALRFTL